MRRWGLGARERARALGGVRVAGAFGLVIASIACAGPAKSAKPATEEAAFAGGADARSSDGDEQLGDALSDAVKRGELGQFDLTDAALIASGFESSSALRQARARLESLVAPVLEPLVKVSDPKERGRLLLASLHQKGGLLGEYDARATTLGEILDRRRYNCVSASVLYNVLAERLGLAASAQLLPTHARTLLRFDRSTKPLIVETTSPDGFDPDVRLEASILAQVGGSLAEGGRQLVPDKGAVTSTLVLIGTIYVNRASIVQEGGDLEGAEHLFARGEAFAREADMKRVLRDQRAALLSQLGADDVLSEDPKRLPRAYRTLRAAAALDPSHAQIRAAVLQNLRAAAERMIHVLADAKDEKPLLELASEAAASGLAPADRSGVRAFALSEVARLRIDKNDFDGALTAIEQALKEQLGADDAKLAKALAQNHLSTLRLAALTAAKQGAYERARTLMDRAERLDGLTAAQKTEVKEDALRIVHLAGNKLIDDTDFKGAAAVYRDGLRRFPGDDTCRHNLIAVLERLALPLVTKAECQAAGELLDEIRVLDPASAFPTKARVRCLMERAEQRLAAEDYPEAVSLMRAARKVSPSEAGVANNLAVALLRWAAKLSNAGKCAESTALADEVRALALPQISRGEIARALGSCKS